MTNEETENLITDLSKGDYSDELLSNLCLAIRQLRTDRADEAWNEGFNRAKKMASEVADALDSQRGNLDAIKEHWIGDKLVTLDGTGNEASIAKAILDLKSDRPTQLKPELTVGLFKVGDWVIRKREYQTAPWIWGGQPCEITGVGEKTINIKVYGVSLNGTWGFSYFTLAPTTEQSLDEPVIMPAWDDLPKEQKKDDGSHWVSPNGAFVDEQGYTFIRSALQSLQKSKGAAVPLPDKETL